MDSDAVPPSSPPYAIATNPPSSPFFTPERYGALSPKSSSPPPLFSSDDSGETLDITNYESPRIFKNKRKGAWYETDNGDSVQNTPEPKKTKISRNYDSGVYMMSDSSDGSVDPLPEHKSPFPFVAEVECNEEPEPMGMTEAAFYSVLRLGLDRNWQNYDFQGLDLGDSDIKQIGDLNSVIKNLPDPGNDLPAEGQYRSMVPELYINLSRNSLRRMTPSLFHLQHLTTLVLRHNEIEEVPPQISQLQNLQELDLSLNRLQHLPFEILRMLAPHGKLEHFQTLGNPIFERVSQSRYRRLDELVSFTSSTKDMYTRLQTCEDREALVWHIRFLESMNVFLDAVESKHTLGDQFVDERVFLHHPTISSGRTAGSPPARYMARTLVAYLDQTGQPLKGSPTLPSASNDDYTVIVDTDEGAFGVPSHPIFTPPTSSRIPSLLTMSLNTAFRNITVEETRERIGEPVPFDATSIFARAVHNDANAGFGYFHECHVCKKDYIVARAEWIEFWSTSFTVFYPFRVRVCSWGCVPPEMTKKPAKELLW